MGMAASQARYLGLTARKTNVEYEGQQINQARTALANQSANTFNDLLALEVPTAPSTQDFTTTQYSYEDGTNSETITSMDPLVNDPDGYNYQVTHYHYSDIFTGIESRMTNPQVYVTDKVSANTVESNKVQTTTDPATGEVTYTIKGKEASVYDETDTAQKTAFDQISNAYPELKNAAPENILTYNDDSGTIHFALKDQLDQTAAGTGGANDYYIKNSKPTYDTIEANKVSSATDPATGAKSYNVNGNATQAYDPNNTELKDAYDKIVKEQPELSTIDQDKLVYYKDASNGIHFMSTDNLEASINGGEDLKDFTMSPGTPVSVGNNELSVYDPTDKTQLAAYEQILKDWPDSNFAHETGTIYTWTIDGQMYFACETDLLASWTSAPDVEHQTENQGKLSYYSAQDVSTKIEVTERAMVDFDDSGRAQTIRFEDSSVVRTLNAETVTDEAAYNDAMNQYNYNQTVYEKKLADINAKTEKIQEQDRTLELRLRQLDTEQEALQTEMEAVKKVIDKNIESTFKTFE